MPRATFHIVELGYSPVNAAYIWFTFAIATITHKWSWGIQYMGVN